MLHSIPQHASVTFLIPSPCDRLWGLLPSVLEQWTWCPAPLGLPLVSLGDVSSCGVAEPEGLHLFTNVGKCYPAWGTSLSPSASMWGFPLLSIFSSVWWYYLSLIGNLTSIKWSLVFAFWTPVRLIDCSCWLKFLFVSLLFIHFAHLSIRFYNFFFYILVSNSLFHFNTVKIHPF